MPDEHGQTVIPPTPAQERVFTAYHEAGHLVAALTFRVMPRGATIHPTMEHLGLVIAADRRTAGPGVNAETWLAGLDRLGAHARAVELMAGFAAEEKAGHPAPHLFAEQDRAIARDLLFDRFQKREVAERELARATMHARQLMERREVWSAVDLIVAELLERETIWAQSWRRAALEAARLIHGRHLGASELARGVGSAVVAEDEERERASAAAGTAGMRRGTWAENAGWAAAMVAFHGLLFALTYAAQKASEDKWRTRYEERIRTAQQQQMLVPAPLPPAVIEAIHNSALTAEIAKYRVLRLEHVPE